mmetsp:Transcript_12607/g.26507  ORF Transcript_12607/g.26507 Transcript_12607/m.26507 type:complete len:330 (-) Transcript_12607:92-1081(-)
MTPSTAQFPRANEPYTSCPQVPSLKCRNGSTCILGEATFDSKHDSLDLLTHESGYHCDCLPGFIGHECEVQVDDCGTNGSGNGGEDPFGSILHSCYHGSSCRQSGSGYYCDCDSLNNESAPMASKFAGLMCEHEATSLCAVSLVQTSAPNGQFCTNHGKCVKFVTEGEEHPGCECRSGWMGDHCEIRADAFAALGMKKMEEGSGSGGGGNKTAGTVLFSILIIAIVGVLGVIVAIVIKAKRAEQGPREKAVGKTAMDLGVADLEADGSGTFGTDVQVDEKDAAVNETDEVESPGGGVNLKEEDTISAKNKTNGHDEHDAVEGPSDREIL